MPVVLVLQLFCQQLLAQSISVDLAAGEQLLVLKNGNIVQGFVERTAAEFIVQTAQGSRLIIAADQADFVCGSMEQAYWGKLARIRATDVEGQVQLFNWCLQHHLLTPAQNQIDILLSSDIKATRLEFLNRQLEVGIMQARKQIESSVLASGNSMAQSAAANPEDQIAAVPLPAIDNDEAEPSSLFLGQVAPVFRPLPSLSEELAKSQLPTIQRPSFKTIRSPLDSEKSQILQVGYEDPIEAPASTHDSSGAESLRHHVPATIAELDQTTRAMPKNSLAVFRQKVENVVVARCSKCHDAECTIMPLMHAGRSQPVSRRMSQRNLHSILGHADRQNPLESNLLVAATTAHGGSEDAGIKLDSRQYENMRNWLIMISDQPEQNVIPVEPSPDDALEIDIQSMKPLKSASASQLPPRLPSESELELSPAAVEIPQLDGLQPKFAPRDEFDPELFNRKYVDRID